MEMSHVKDYLYLEKMRFDQKLTVVMELEYTDFILPAMTVQPIAENAVRWGIIKKKGGGTLTIKSEMAEENVIISVIDDGVGFNPLESKNDGKIIFTVVPQPFLLSISIVPLHWIMSRWRTFSMPI